MPDGGSVEDAQLIDRFVVYHDEVAFEGLLRRHGPMVLGVCRRILGDHHDAEDALQATFLILIRKAASLRRRDLVGNWLYGVAYRTSLKAKTTRARRRARELRTAAPATELRSTDGWEDLLTRLDKELNRLPECYRVAVILCELEGRSRRDAAR